MDEADGKSQQVTSQCLGVFPERRLLHGLNVLLNEHVLCDVTLIAEGKRFEVHKVILASCSDYFRTMFTSDMKESSQREIELQGVSSRGLEKIIEVIYTSTTRLDGEDDILDVIADASHLQVTAVMELCEKNIVENMTTSNFSDFIGTAKRYAMTKTLNDIQEFISKNLLKISAEQTLCLVSYDQLLHCVRSETLEFLENDLFRVVLEWLELDTNADEHVVSLMENIRFPLISQFELVDRVLGCEMVMKHAELRDLVTWALRYHLVPHSQPVKHSTNTKIRNQTVRLACVGGHENNPDGLQDRIYVLESAITPENFAERLEIATLPKPVNYMQVIAIESFLYVIGGCLPDCLDSKNAVNTVWRYDTRFKTWFEAAPMIGKRTFFVACALQNRIYAVGGKFKDEGLSTAECYDLERNVWEPIQDLPSGIFAHAGVASNGYVYVAGGFGDNFYMADLQRYDPLTQSWDALTPMSQPRCWHSMCVSNRGQLLVFGGRNQDGNATEQPVLEAESYDPATEQWTAIDPIPVPHLFSSCVVYQNDVFVLGGTKEVSRYDLASNLWESFATLPEQQTGVGYAVLSLPAYSFQSND